jgi:hypothetical protein
MISPADIVSENYSHLSNLTYIGLKDSAPFLLFLLQCTLSGVIFDSTRSPHLLSPNIASFPGAFGAFEESGHVRTRVYCTCRNEKVKKAPNLLSLLLWQSEIRKYFSDTMSAGESSVPKSGGKSPSNLRSAHSISTRDK